VFFHFLANQPLPRFFMARTDGKNQFYFLTIAFFYLQAIVFASFHRSTIYEDDFLVDSTFISCTTAYFLFRVVFFVACDYILSQRRMICC
jgi:hypothetical protein